MLAQTSGAPPNDGREIAAQISAAAEGAGIQHGKAGRVLCLRATPYALTLGSMGLVDRLLGRQGTAGSTLRPVPVVAPAVADRFAPLPDDHHMKVVGESHCQDALRALAGRCAPGEDGRPSFSANLIPEPENQFDRNAVAVYGPTGRLGYLAREDAERYRRTFDRLRAHGYAGGSCVGLLNGGEPGRPSYGVVLKLAYPEVCETRLGIVSGSVADGHSRAAVSTCPEAELRGRHYTTYTDEVKTLRRHGQDDSAEKLLLELLEVVEAEASAQGWGVAPWYYEQLAIIYRKRKDSSAEVAVLERYAAAPHAPGAGPERLRERLEKARQRAARADAGI